MSDSTHGVRDLFTRIRAAELAAVESRVEAKAVAADVKDHELRLRALENLTAKVVGGSVLGGGIVSFIAWLLNYVR